MRTDDLEEKALDFKGLLQRGNLQMEGYFSDCLNVDYEIGEVSTRPGLSTAITLGYGSGNGKVRRTANFITSVGRITLILDDGGNFYTYSSRTGDTATTPRFTKIAATDFAAIQMLGKIYIAFSSGGQGVQGYYLMVYIPNSSIASDEFRDAAGLAPVAGGAMSAANGAAGGVLAGTYKIAVAYVTTSGYITQPGPKVATVFTPTTYVAPGAVKISLSSIPTGPSGTLHRQILITKANQEEYFFLPSEFGGLITNNVSTTATLDFNSVTDLLESADYLFDLLTQIESPLGLDDFEGRLVTYGEANNRTIVRLSYPGDPESFDAVDGVVVVHKDAGFSMTNTVVIRKVLYACTELGIHAFVDNDDVPSTWPTPDIDRSVSVSTNGIASFFQVAAVKIAREWTLLVDRSGILMFTGAIVKPPITEYINDIWKRINFISYHKIVITIDERAHKIYCSIPLDSAVENDTLLVGDYNSCPGKIPSIEGLKWAIWRFQPNGTTRGISDIAMTLLTGENTPTIKLASSGGGGKIWQFDTANRGIDEGNTIQSYFETVELTYKTGSWNQFNLAELEVSGDGTLLCSISGKGGKYSTNLEPLELQEHADITAQFGANGFQDEAAKWKFITNSGYFTVSKLSIYGKVMAQTRPR